MPTTIQTQVMTRGHLCQEALDNGEVKQASNGAIVADTGHRTGRSTGDRFIVQDDNTLLNVDWGRINQPMQPQQFKQLWEKAQHHMEGCQVYQSQMYVGADNDYKISVDVTTELSWHHVFLKHLFIQDQLTMPKERQWELISLATCLLDPVVDQTPSDAVVAIDLTQKRVLICGMRYAGEMKKAFFSIMNYLMPTEDVLPMHCAANVGKKQGDVALFFGLSGTGKTTLSADDDRLLIGDDEHGWSPKGIFNFEGGCYAKCIDLSKETEPLIWNAIRETSVLENVVLDSDGFPNYSDSSKTANTRAAYPRDFLPDCQPTNMSTHPRTVILLTCDLYGVLPPVALLSQKQAVYYFLNGYTALVGSTELGSDSAIKPTFSRCFGAPFFPRHATTYADLFQRRLSETNANVYLINTGWTGGGYETGGKRFSIATSRRIVTAVLTGQVLLSPLRRLPGFNLEVPEKIAGIDPNILNPSLTWTNPDLFKRTTNTLILKFIDNFKSLGVDIYSDDFPCTV
ncbi:MAG: phosphoenolpyruvate carboxykinase (ATP) [Legionellales bacterium]|nr:phosphoenolpyruvate carboxykinase (ATP) [Legionellales bacterium]